MLVLFDIDGTLISTSGVGIRAMEEAAAEIYGLNGAAATVEYAGRLDPLIISDLIRLAGAIPTAEAISRFRAAYGAALQRWIRDPAVEAKALPGVPALLDALARTEGVTLGLLTGNYQETGSLKLRACGIDPDRFEVAVWGDASPHEPPARDHLPPIALARFAAARGGRAINPDHITVIGDTPHDVGCARAGACRSIAVATGRYGVDELAAAGADWAIENLLKTDELVLWITRRADRERHPAGDGREAG